MDPNLAVSLVFAIGVLFIFIGIDQVVHSRTASINSRLDRYAMRQITVPIDFPGLASRAKGNRFSRFFPAGGGSQLATDLARADLRLTPGEYMLFNLASTVIGFIVAFIIFHGDLGNGISPGFLLAFIGGLVGFYFPRWYVRFLQRKRINSFNGQLGDTIVLLSNSLRSGYSLLQSMETVSKELNAPMSVEFARVTREIGLGLTIQEALANLVRRIPSDDLDLMITAINVQHEVGGNLAEILDTIAHTIRERVRIKGEIRSITSQQRLSGNLLSVLPLILGLVLYAINPGYISGLWQNLCGWAMMGVGGVMIVIGYFVIRRIADIEV